MGYTITFPSNTTDVIDAIRGAIGRDVFFHVPYSSSPCPVCDINPITNESTNPFCLTCSGIGYIYYYNDVSVSGHINWGHSERLGWVQGGTLFDGDCLVQIKYTPENITVVDTAKWVIVDGKVMTVKDKILRGVKNINRILLNLIERDKEE